MPSVQFGRFPTEYVPGSQRVAGYVLRLSFVRPRAGFGLAAYCGTTTRTVLFLLLVLRYETEVEYATEDAVDQDFVLLSQQCLINMGAKNK
jgi:hypothetical protein